MHLIGELKAYQQKANDSQENIVNLRLENKESRDLFASVEETFYKSLLLLIFYSLGLAIPFIISGYAINKLLGFSKRMKNYTTIATKFGGIILLITGALIITNQLQIIGFYILETLPFLQNFG